MGDRYVSSKREDGEFSPRGQSGGLRPDHRYDGTKTIYVGQLRYDTDERTVRKFEAYGPVATVKVRRRRAAAPGQCSGAALKPAPHSFPWLTACCRQGFIGSGTFPCGRCIKRQRRRRCSIRGLHPTRPLVCHPSCAPPCS